MRVYRVVLVVAVLIFAGCVMRMDKSDGTRKEVKSSVSKEIAAPAKVEAKACPKTSCSKDASTSVKAEAEGAADELFVTVNGVKVTQATIDEKIKPQIDAQIKLLKAPGTPINKYLIPSMTKRMTYDGLEKLIIELLASEKAEAYNIKITSEDIQAMVESMAKNKNIPMDKLAEVMGEYGITIDDLKSQMRTDLILKKAIEIEAKAAGISDTPSDKEVKKYYDENRGQFTIPEMVRASHILIKTEELDDAAKAEAKVKIEGLLKEARSGSDFAAMAKAHSDDPSCKETGGEYTFAKGQMVSVFEEAAFSLEVGKVSDVVETSFGYHIIKLSEKIAAKDLTFEEVTADIKTQIVNAKVGEFARGYTDKLKSEANIVWAEGKKHTRRRRPGIDPPANK